MINQTAMAKKDPVPLSQDEIEEELLNDNLRETGGVENDSQLQNMSVEEKKDLLKGIRQSKEESSNQPAAPSSHQSPLTLAGFPSLPASGKKELPANRLKLPRKSNTPPTAKVSEEMSYKTFNLPDDEENVKFSLPFCIADGASPLISQRHLKTTKDPYYRMRHETDIVAVKRMINHHNQWKGSYIEETNRIESDTVEKDISYKEEGRDSHKISKFEEKENDSYIAVSESIKNSFKPYVDQRKAEISSNSGILNNRLGQRKTNRDSDCEELEPNLKNEEPKGTPNEWRIANHSRSKRNRKQAHKEVRQEAGSSPEVEFEFDNKWDPRSSNWRGSPSGGPSSVLPLPPFSNTNQVEEQKVQCPICQKNFALSKVENHAATCEGFSDSPMDVEEET